MDKQLLFVLLVSAALLLTAFGAYESVNAALVLAGGGAAGPFAYPVWSLTHFIPGLLFTALAPLQLWPALRSRYRKLHRWSGRVVVLSALALGLSGLALPFIMPERPVAQQVYMLVFGGLFLVLVAKGFLAALRGNFVAHRVWMIRTFAVGLAITTQRLLMLIFINAFGVSGMEQFWTHFVVAAWLAFAIHIAAAELWIRRLSVPVMQGRAVAAQA